MRSSCLRCLKPQSTCLCAELRSVRLAFDLVLLQHPKERKKTTATARMTHLWIEGSRLISGTGFDGNPEVDALLDDPARRCVVLYPGSDSIDLGALAADDLQSRLLNGARLTVFVIDATWSLARSMILRSPRLMALPRICFSPAQGSEYGFKRQPAEYCVSTLEAVREIIRYLQPEVETGPMRLAFLQMVRKQLSYTEPAISAGLSEPSISIRDC